MVQETGTDDWKGVLATLEGMRQLKDDWDGDGAVAPTAPIIDTAIKYVDIWETIAIDPPGRVIVGVNGTVIFEWSDGGQMEVIAMNAVRMRNMAQHILQQE